MSADLGTPFPFAGDVGVPPPPPPPRNRLEQQAGEAGSLTAGQQASRTAKLLHHPHDLQEDAYKAQTTRSGSASDLPYSITQHRATLRVILLFLYLPDDVSVRAVHREHRRWRRLPAITRNWITSLVAQAPLIARLDIEMTPPRPGSGAPKAKRAQILEEQDKDASPITALKRKHSALCQAYAEQGRELSRLKAQYEPGPLEDSPTRVDSSVSSQNSLQSVDSSSHQTPSFNTLPSTTSPPQQRSEEPDGSAERLLKALVSQSDIESTTLLARLRLGEDWRVIANDLPPEAVTSETGIQRIAHYMQSATQVTAKHWLPAIFDRQYFMQIGYIPCIPKPSSFPTTPGSTFNFGNLPFSSAIAANHHPPHIQQAQQDNLSGPLWAKPILNGSTINADPFEALLAEMRDDLACGVSMDDLCGPHPFIGALDDEHTFYRAPKLSQIVARIVGSIKSTDESTTFTQYAMMYWFWALWRWILKPTTETYRAIPEFAKPTSSQLFISHPSVFDFILLPKLRDMVCQADTPNVQWMTEAAITIHCIRDESLTSTLSRDGMTHELDLNPICKQLTFFKAFISSEQNWALGPSVREFLSDADSFVPIRDTAPP
ncbi:hypothetical protein Q7P37_002547 [Cladosporium fusiforme]